MSIIIKGIKMPKSCEECQVCDYEEGNCLLTGTYLISDGRNTLPHNGERREWCPLVELPPHGRLIDADVLLFMMGKTFESLKTYYSQEDREKAHMFAAFLTLGKMVRHMPTIIEAEEAKE